MNGELGTGRRAVVVSQNVSASAVVSEAQVGSIRDLATGQCIATLKYAPHFGWKVMPMPRCGEPSRRWYPSIYAACQARGWVPSEAKVEVISGR